MELADIKKQLIRFLRKKLIGYIYCQSQGQTGNTTEFFLKMEKQLLQL